MSTQTEKNPAATGVRDANAAAPALEQLAEVAMLIASARDAMSDEMVARLARALSEGVVLLDRLTRNEGLMRLLRELDRPESQQLLIALCGALGPMSRDVAASAPASGGLGGLWKLAREPRTQEALRALSVLGQYWAEGIRKADRSARAR